MKGRDKHGRPTEGVDEVPIRPKSKKKQECMSQLVAMLQQANKRGIEGVREIFETQATCAWIVKRTKTTLGMVVITKCVVSARKRSKP